MTVYLDIGNSRIKWASDDGDWRVGELCERTAFSADHARRLAAAVPGRQLCAVSVASDDFNRRLEQEFGAAGFDRPEFMAVERRRAGVVNRYNNPSALGCDRWAAALAVREMSVHDTVIVDAGTAVTVDLLKSSGEYEGGAIVPGIGLQHRALLGSTDRIRAASVDRPALPARQTGDAVRAGVIFGLAGAIDALVERLRELASGADVVGTGGDMVFLSEYMQIEIEIVPDLVLRGVRAFRNSRD